MTMLPTDSKGGSGPTLGRLVAVLALANATLAPMCLSYKSDIQRTCDAEHLAGVKADSPALIEWLKRNVNTPDGVVLANELSTKSPRDRSLQLQAEARKEGFPGCPLADSFEALAKDQAWKQDVANLCDGHALLPGGFAAAVLDIGALTDDGERLREITEWSQAQLKTPDAQTFVGKLEKVAPRNRGQALRAEATRAGITTPCSVADALDRPLPTAPKPVAAPVLPTLTITTYDSDKPNAKYRNTAIDGVKGIGASINTCYAGGLLRDPKLNGKVSVKVSLDGTGKVLSASTDGSALTDKKVLKCIAGEAFANATLPKPPDKGGVKFTIGFGLSPTTSSAVLPVSVALAVKGPGR
jgi:hypothetical protein